MDKMRLVWVALVTYIKDLFKNKYSVYKILITIISGIAIVWAMIVSLTYVGCLESVLLCPSAYFGIPFIDFKWNIPVTELPLLLIVIVMASINLSTMFALSEVRKFHYYLTLIIVLLMLVSLIFITSVVSFEAVLNQEINRLIRENRL